MDGAPCFIKGVGQGRQTFLTACLFPTFAKPIGNGVYSLCSLLIGLTALHERETKMAEYQFNLKRKCAQRFKVSITRITESTSNVLSRNS